MKIFKYILLLTSIVFLFSHCGQTNEKYSTMTDHFDENGGIFLKLYRQTDQGVKYWETWNTNVKSATIHWGQLGDTGQNKKVTGFTQKGFQEELNILIDEKLKEGYREIPYEEQYTVAVTFSLESWGTSEDLDRREEIRNILTEHLGWTGNGRCDDGDIGSGEMTLYADVIDPYIAVRTITKEFQDRKIDDRYQFTIMQGENIIERDYKPKNE